MVLRYHQQMHELESKKRDLESKTDGCRSKLEVEGVDLAYALPFRPIFSVYINAYPPIISTCSFCRVAEYMLVFSSIGNSVT